MLPKRGGMSTTNSSASGGSSASWASIADASSGSSSPSCSVKLVCFTTSRGASSLLGTTASGTRSAGVERATPSEADTTNESLRGSCPSFPLPTYSTREKSNADAATVLPFTK